MGGQARPRLGVATMGTYPGYTGAYPDLVGTVVALEESSTLTILGTLQGLQQDGAESSLAFHESFRVPARRASATRTPESSRTLLWCTLPPSLSCCLRSFLASLPSSLPKLPRFSKHPPFFLTISSLVSHLPPPPLCLCHTCSSHG